MARPPGIRDALWQEFLQRHHLGERDHQDFGAYLARAGALPIESLQDLEDDYMDFLRASGRPTPPP